MVFSPDPLYNKIIKEIVLWGTKTNFFFLLKTNNTSVPTEVLFVEFFYLSKDKNVFQTIYWNMIAINYTCHCPKILLMQIYS